MTRPAFDSIFCIVVTLFASVWQLIGPQGLEFWFVPYVIFVCWLSLVAGRLLSHWGGQSSSSPLADLMDFVGGSFLLQLSIFFTVYLFHVNVVTSLAVVGGGILCCYGIVHRQISPRDYDGSQSVQSLAVLLLVLVAGSLWCQQALIQYVPQEGNVFFQPSIDFYTHTGIFLPFTHGDYNVENFFFSGERIYFYHYASYMLPAAVAGLGIESALDVTTAFWLPFAVFLVGLSAFGLGREYGGFAAGLGAVGTVLLVPDASIYLFNNKYFSFHWLLQLSPGCAYGLALIAYGLVWLVRYKKDNNRRALGGVLIVLTLMIFIRAQFLPLFAGMLIIWLVLFSSNLHLFYRTVLAGFGMAIILLRPWIVSHLILAPSLVGPPGGPVFIPAALSSRVGGGNYFGAAEMILESDSLGILIFGGLLLIAISILGSYLFVTIIVLTLRVIRGAHVLYWDSLPWIALGCYSLLAWFLPVSERTNPYELTHRPFVIVYFLFAVWLGGELFRWLPLGQKRAVQYGMISVLVGAGLFTPLCLGKGIHGDQLSRVPMQKGIYEAALFLRKNAKQGDVFIDTGFNYYGTIGFLALSETKAFFSPTMASFVNRNRPQYRERFQSRLVFRKEFNNTTSLAEVERMAHEKGIRWAIIQDGHRSAWEAGALRAKVFESHNTRVYDLHCLLSNKEST